MRQHLATYETKFAERVDLKVRCMEMIDQLEQRKIAIESLGSVIGPKHM